MPVTAKLSKKFYEVLGEDVANELVDWFNQVDATYRADLRELNDLNFQRFDAKMGERLAQSDARMQKRLVQLEARIEKRLVQLEAKVQGSLAALQAVFEQRLAEFGGVMESRLAEFGGVMESRLAEFGGVMESRLAGFGEQFAEFQVRAEARFATKADLAAMRDELLAQMVTREQLAVFGAEMSDKLSGLLKWMVVLWSTTVLAVITAGIFG